MVTTIVTVDLGTSGLRTTVWRADGRIAGHAAATYPTRRDRPDHAEQRPQDWWNAFRRTLKKAAGLGAKRVRAVTIASQREGMVPVDETGRALSDCIIWMDNRTGPQLDEVRKRFSDAEVYRVTGLLPAIYYSACKILWIMRHQPGLHRRARWYLQPGEYLMMRLTGRPAADLSMASRTMLLDVRKRQWSRKLLSGLGIPGEKLPPLLEPGSVAGIVRKDMAGRLGLGPDVDVIVGGGDQQCGAVGCGAINEKVASVSLGTSTTLSLSVDRPARPAGTRPPCCISAVPGKWEMEPAMWTSGTILSWLGERLGRAGGQIDKLLARAAQVPPGSDGLYLLPYFMGAGSPNWNPSARGAYVGLTLGHTNGHLARAILEGNAYDIRMNLEALNACGFRPRRLVANGRGSRSRLWCQIISDVTALPVDVPRNTEAVSFGLFLLAHAAMGYSRSVQQAARKFVVIDRRHRPRATRRRTYDGFYAEFKKLAAILDPFYRSHRRTLSSLRRRRSKR